MCFSFISVSFHMCDRFFKAFKETTATTPYWQRILTENDCWHGNNNHLICWNLSSLWFRPYLPFTTGPNRSAHFSAIESNQASDTPFENDNLLLSNSTVFPVIPVNTAVSTLIILSLCNLFCFHYTSTKQSSSAIFPHFCSSTDCILHLFTVSESAVKYLAKLCLRPYVFHLFHTNGLE